MTATNNLPHETADGTLSGRAILRFAHAFESGGGTERYLDDLDHALLHRNRMTIVRLHLTLGPAAPPQQDAIGQGRLIRVPLLASSRGPTGTDDRPRRWRKWFTAQSRNLVLYNPLVWHTIGRRWALTRSLPMRPGQAPAAGAAVTRWLQTTPIDAVMLHYVGGRDADDVITATRRAGVPIGLLNHYSNDRFLHVSVRRHALMADHVAGVTGLHVPRFLSGRFTNLADGIDTSFFQATHARPLPNAPGPPTILLPARVVREKGHLDLVRAVAALRAYGVSCSVVFAGRIDSPAFETDLRRAIDRAGLTAQIRLLGPIALEELRNWYAAATLVALPTYHDEGLPRTVLEAQAMGTPVVAYATGGVPDAITPDVTGFLVRTGDVTALGMQLLQLLSTPRLRAAVATAARQVAEIRFSLAALADRHERFYAAMMSDAAHGAR